MNFYNNIIQNKELWIRDIRDNIKSGYDMLSSVYIKYKDINLNFFNCLSTNQITRFDVFYDSIFVETQNYGYIFEKIILENFNLQPYSQSNLYNISSTTKIDYFFNENRKIVYFCGFYDIEPESNNKIKISFFFKEFNIDNGKINKILEKTITLNLLKPSSELDNSNVVKENPKLTYNFDTNTFNISFLIRSNTNKFGLISVNFNEFDVIELNVFIPFVELDLSTSTIT